MENIWGYGLLFVGLWCLIFIITLLVASAAVGERGEKLDYHTAWGAVIVSVFLALGITLTVAGIIWISQ